MEIMCALNKVGGLHGGTGSEPTADQGNSPATALKTATQTPTAFSQGGVAIPFSPHFRKPILLARADCLGGDLLTATSHTRSTDKATVRTGIEMLLKLAKTCTDDVKRQVIGERLLIKGDGTEKELGLKILNDIMTGAQDRKIRLEIAKVILTTPHAPGKEEALEVLQRLVEDGSAPDAVRLGAIEELMKRSDASAKKAVLKQLGTLVPSMSDDMSRYKTADLLLNFGDGAARNDALTILTSLADKAPERMRIHASLVLVRKGDETAKQEGLRCFARLLKGTRDKSVQLDAAVYLLQYGDVKQKKVASKALLAGLSKKNDEMHRFVVAINVVRYGDRDSKMKAYGVIKELAKTAKLPIVRIDAMMKLHSLKRYIAKN
jgi:hypothetical protein